MRGLTSLMLILTLGLLIPGVVNRLRAVMAGRRGVSFFQHVSNLSLLLRKGSVYSPVTTLITRLAPAVCLASSLTAALLMPVGYFTPMLSFKGDVVAFCYLLAAGRMALVLAALDTGSSFEGMGASREALYGALAEPAMMLIAGTLAMITGMTSFGAMFVGTAGVGAEMIIVGLMLFYALYNIFTVETGRVPLDDPRTHLELTMVHEVMVLDYTGVDLGMITMSGWLKGAALAMLAGNAVAALVSNSFFVAVAAALAVAVAVAATESLRARNRMTRNATYILSILAVVLLTFMVALLIRSNIPLA